MAKISKTKQAFIDKVVKLGWTLDPDATIPGYFGDTVEPSPYHFIKEIDGGRYRIFLDYQVKYGYRPDYHGPTLRYVKLEHRSPDPHQVTGESYWRHVVTLGRPTGYDTRYLKNIWQVCSISEDTPMKARAELFIADPLLCAWLAAETDYADELEKREARRLERIDLKERRRPLPVTVSQGEYWSEWSELTRKLVKAANAIHDADGKSDLYALAADAAEALSNVAAVIKPKELAST